ncbi:GAF domain-containing protein [Sphingobacterium allocomposti]|uniref:GAF domain-containing protein n=1 Tax=Sphingobacterium allocomposti TaxID=415956 RepID=A0A5S5DRJ1_9SPHI|nr:GAF domain-containing protein [Sphingobacterium composti Yoo et al. 2007 non Ten et al. 2007]TYP98497.1 GAF domain-containing protein [Sphingobacterium composti Yoo et al. 2007 non Ten et al. 2007]
MAEDLQIATGSKEEQYRLLFKQIEALVSGETDRIANMANIAAALKEQFNFWWVGFYLVTDEQLVLGPFQGPVACTRIGYGKGVCGSAWQKGSTVIVPDVDAFPGHIACSSLSRSEIVVPVFQNDQCIGVLDVDSEFLNHFDQIDATYLEQICSLIA